jgi:hypothetical protein
MHVEQLTKKVPTIEEICRAINKYDSSMPVFLVCDSDNALLEFKDRLNNKVNHYDMPRSTQNGEHHFEERLDEIHVQTMVAQTIALSRCKHFVHHVSNIATAVLYMNPEMSHTFVQG